MNEKVDSLKNDSGKIQHSCVLNIHKLRLDSLHLMWNANQLTNLNRYRTFGKHRIRDWISMIYACYIILYYSFKVNYNRLTWGAVQSKR